MTIHIVNTLYVYSYMLLYIVQTFDYEVFVFRFMTIHIVNTLYVYSYMLLYIVQTFDSEVFLFRS